MKKALCFIISILLCIESFAAVISDSDGSAFVTKADFEELKNSFTSQVNNYNSSIDGKIDGAIANYLSGVRLDSHPTNLIKSFEETTGKKQKWMYKIPGAGTSTIQNDVMQTVECELAAKRVNNFSIKLAKWEGAQDQVSYFITGILFPSSTWNNTYAYIDYYAEQRPGGTNVTGRVAYPTGNITTETARQKLSLATYGTFTQKTSVISQPYTGSGSGWLWQNFGNGKLNLKYYCTALYPSFNVLWQMHYYKEFPAATTDYYLKSTGLTISDKSVPTLATLESAWGTKKTVGTKASSSTDTNLRNYAEMTSFLVRTDDGTNYLDVVWGLTATTQVYCVDEDVVPTLNSSTTSLSVSSDVKYQNQAYQLEGFKTFETSYPTKTQAVKLRTLTMQRKPLSDFCNNTLSNIAAETVYNGNGAPCYYCSDPDTTNTGRIKLTTTSGTCQCSVVISDKPFNNGAVAVGGNTILSTTVTTGTERSFTLNNLGTGNYYIFIKNNTNTNPITIDKFEIQ